LNLLCGQRTIGDPEVIETTDEVVGRLLDGSTIMEQGVAAAPQVDVAGMRTE
jgi:hypothetical protein